MIIEEKSMKPPRSSESAAEAGGKESPAAGLINPVEDGPTLLSLSSGLFKEVSVTLRANLGEISMTIDELLSIKTGSVLKLNAQLNDPVDLRLNQSLVARGEIVAVGDNFGIRIVEVAKLS